MNEGVLLLFCSYKPFRAQFAAGDFAKNEKRKTFPLLPCSEASQSRSIPEKKKMPIA